MEYKKSEKLISIAMATYNGAGFIREQLDSLVGQSYSNVEIAISDDNSTDDTISIIKEYQSNHSNIHLYHNDPTSKGILKNFENALRNCKGDFICLADQDDIWEPGKVLTLSERIGDNIMIYHDSDFINEQGETIPGKISGSFNFYKGNDPRAFFLINCISGHAMMFRRELIEQALPFPQSRYHDWWLAFCAACRGNIDFITEPLVHYRQHDRSKTDILKRRSDYRHPGAENKFLSEKEWYRRCSEHPSQHQEFFKKWYRAYLDTERSWFNYELMSLGLRNQDILFTISKESSYKQKAELAKIATGLPVKKILL